MPATVNWLWGVRIFFNRRMFLAPEARFGWEPIVRLGGRIGWVPD